MLNIQNSIIKTISTSSLQELASDNCEILLDTLTTNEALKSIPILGSIVNLGKGVLQVREQIFCRKIMKFLSQLSDIDESQRQKFITENYETLEEQERLGRTLIEILDHLDDSNKSELIGKIFKKYITEDITYDEMLRAIRTVSRIFIEDLNDFKWFEDYRSRKSDLPWISLSEFVSLGLIRKNFNFIDGDPEENHLMYRPENFILTPLGKLITELDVL